METSLRLKLATPQTRDKHSTTEPLRSQYMTHDKVNSLEYIHYLTLENFVYLDLWVILTVDLEIFASVLVL